METLVKTDAVFLNNSMNTDCKRYDLMTSNVLYDHFLLVSETIVGPCFMFQKDNAPIHIVNSTFEWFHSNGVHIFDWSSISPNLIPIGNLCGKLARAVYAGGKQYNSTNVLKQAILSE